MIHYTHRDEEGKKKESVQCAAMQLTLNHNPRTMWNVSSNCQWLKLTLAEQLQYTVSGRVLSLRIKIKCRPLHRYSRGGRERGDSCTQLPSETQRECSLQAQRCYGRFYTHRHRCGWDGRTYFKNVDNIGISFPNTLCDAIKYSWHVLGWGHSWAIHISVVLKVKMQIISFTALLSCLTHSLDPMCSLLLLSILDTHRCRRTVTGTTY